MKVTSQPHRRIRRAGAVQYNYSGIGYPAVAGQFCAFCGKPIPGGATFCPSCGAAVSGGTPLPPGPAYRSPYASTPPTSGTWMPGGGAYPPAPGAEDSAREVAALESIERAAIVALVGFAFSTAFLLLAPVSAALSAGSGTSSSVRLSVNWGLFYALLVGSGIFTLLQLAFYRGGFSHLMVKDSRFRAPAVLSIVAMVGYVMILAGAAILVNALVAATSRCAGLTGTAWESCLASGSFGGGFALAGIGVILALVGFVGVLIGIWRLGSRYDDGMFKAGAVLLIFPILDLIGAILILVAAHDCRRKVRAGNPYGSAAFPR